MCIGYFQHTPAGQLRRCFAHDLIPKCIELLPHDWFRMVISCHPISWTVLDGNNFSLDEVVHVKVLDVEMSCTFSRTSFTILFQLHGGLIVAKDYMMFQFVACASKK